MFTTDPPPHGRSVSALILIVWVLQRHYPSTMQQPHMLTAFCMRFRRVLHRLFAPWVLTLSTRCNNWTAFIRLKANRYLHSGGKYDLSINIGSRRKKLRSKIWQSYGICNSIKYPDFAALFWKGFQVHYGYSKWARHTTAWRMWARAWSLDCRLEDICCPRHMTAVSIPRCRYSHRTWECRRKWADFGQTKELLGRVPQISGGKYGIGECGSVGFILKSKGYGRSHSTSPEKEYFIVQCAKALETAKMSSIFASS